MRVILLSAGLLLCCCIAHGQTLEAWPPDAGVVGDEQLPLVAESLQVAIDHQFASSVHTQVYQNLSEQQLEGRFRQTVLDGERVQGFAYWNGETKIVGEVFEKEVARAIYEQTTGLRRDPGLLEDDGVNTFRFRVFPIEPGERKKVEVRTGVYLARNGRSVTYRAQLGGPDASIAIELRDERTLTNLRSSSHQIDVERAGDGLLRVSARNGGDQLVLQYDVDEPAWTVSTRVHRDPGQPAYLAISMPTPLDKSDVSPKDITLLLDCSGSMLGEPLEQERRSAAAIIERLGRYDRLNVIAFDDTVDLLFGKPRPVTDDVKQQAAAFLRQNVRGGGTDIAGALRRAMAAQESDARPHVVILLTDGNANDIQQVFKAAGDRRDVQLFTVGLGNGINGALLSRLAKEMRGRALFVRTAESLVEQMGRLFAQLDEPLLLNVTVESEGLPLLRVFPRSIADLQPGEELLVMARVPDSGNLNLAIGGTIAGRAVRHEVAVAIPEAVRQPWVGRLWAAARVDDLTEEMQLQGETDELKNETIELALAYNLVSRYTSFLAIPESELTGDSQQLMQSARARKQVIMAQRKDALALSRDNMPPGDPLLTVEAPADARQVTAYFPFGLVKDLHFNPYTGKWQVRFLVPSDVEDGDYEVRVRVVLADGTSQWSTARYHIDSEEPDFDVELVPVPGGVAVLVFANEAVREARVALVADPDQRIALEPNVRGSLYSGFFPLPAGVHELRIVVADTARNEADDVASVVVEE